MNFVTQRRQGGRPSNSFVSRGPSLSPSLSLQNGTIASKRDKLFSVETGLERASGEQGYWGTLLQLPRCMCKRPRNARLAPKWAMDDHN